MLCNKSCLKIFQQHTLDFSSLESFKLVKTENKEKKKKKTKTKNMPVLTKLYWEDDSGAEIGIPGKTESK